MREDRDLKVLDLLARWYTHSMIKKELWVSKTTTSRIRAKHNMSVPEQDRKSKLDKIIEKMEKKWYCITKLNYNWFQVHKTQAMKPYLLWDESNILVIGDLHEPVSLEWYLQFCREQQEKRNCWTVIYIGDIVDFHSISYHEKIPEELNPSWEISYARSKLKDWYTTFPKAKVCYGNHDLLWYRNARTAWLLREFIQSPHQIFWAPLTYEFQEEYIIDNVIYTHGNMGNARKKTPIEWMSMVSWHCHNISWVQYFRNRHQQIFGMQVGTWIDYSKRNFDYARITPKVPILSCWVVLKNWTLPIVIPFTWKT